MSKKGVKYACIEKDGRRFHVFGTHTQAFTVKDPNPDIRE